MPVSPLLALRCSLQPDGGWFRRYRGLGGGKRLLENFQLVMGLSSIVSSVAFALAVLVLPDRLQHMASLGQRSSAR